MEDDLWASHQPIIWKSDRFIGSPTFYPVYTDGHHYSYSLLALILLKGYLSPNWSILEGGDSEGFLYYSGLETVDTQIRRLGGPVRSIRKIRSADSYTQELVKAMVSDAATIESRHPGYTNIILCGGKDSLNLGLLPWRNPTMLASAPPNYELVVRFVDENHLGIPVILLEDIASDGIFRREILSNACRMDLVHARWGSHLNKMASEYDGKVIFWKGQMFDVYATPKWRDYVEKRRNHLVLGAYRRALERRLPDLMRDKIASIWLEQRFRSAAWWRGAMWQGCHTAIIREVTECLVLSAYHGPEVSRVIGSTDLAYAAKRDVRPLLGRYLAGRTVKYPESNPAPAVSAIRNELHKSFRFMDMLREVGVEVISGSFDPESATCY